MEDLIGILVFLAFAGISVLGRFLKRQEGQRGAGQPSWPQPPMAPPQRSGPQPSQPWPAPQAGPQPSQPWPAQQAGPQPGRGPTGPGWPPAPQGPQWPGQPQPVQRTGEGVTLEGRSPSMEGKSIEGRRSEGYSSMTTGSLAEERARFKEQSARFRRSRPDTALHHPEVEAEGLEQSAPNPVAQALASKEGLAQAVLLAEVLGKPRAIRPYGKR